MFFSQEGKEESDLSCVGLYYINRRHGRKFLNHIEKFFIRRLEEGRKYLSYSQFAIYRRQGKKFDVDYFGEEGRKRSF